MLAKQETKFNLKGNSATVVGINLQLPSRVLQTMAYCLLVSCPKINVLGGIFCTKHSAKSVNKPEANCVCALVKLELLYGFKSFLSSQCNTIQNC